MLDRHDDADTKLAQALSMQDMLALRLELVLADNLASRDQRVAALQSISRIWPNDTKCLALLAHIKSQEEGLGVWLALFLADPGNKGAIERVAQALITNNQPEKAARLYQRAIQVAAPGQLTCCCS